MLILIDAMGGDNAPDAVVNGCIRVINEADGFDILMIGDQERIEKILKEKNFNNPRLKVHHANDVIKNEDSPTKAIKSKKDSSMVIGFNLLKEKKGDVFIPAGNTGALLTGALLILGRFKGVDRPALATLIPNKKGVMLLLDAGANTTCKPVNYLQFGIMGSIFMKDVFNIEKPSVGLINVGEEESKGNDVIKQAYDMLSKADINFKGNLEPHRISEGKVDVAVSDGFVGNVLLKTTEGTAKYLFSQIKGIFTKNIINKICALIIKSDFKKLQGLLDPSEYGGAPFLGVNGKVIKAHGRSDARAIKNAILKAYDYAKSPILDEIREQFKSVEVEEIEQ
ncbi:MAG TPA: phosphate acyltransferase PlsX [Clostridia bacterium]